MANPIVTIEMENGDIMKAELYPEVAPKKKKKKKKKKKSVFGGGGGGGGDGGGGFCGFFIFN